MLFSRIFLTVTSEYGMHLASPINNTTEKQEPQRFKTTKVGIPSRANLYNLYRNIALFRSLLRLVLYDKNGSQKTKDNHYSQPSSSLPFKRITVPTNSVAIAQCAVVKWPIFNIRRLVVKTIFKRSPYFNSRHYLHMICKNINFEQLLDS